MMIAWLLISIALTVTVLVLIVAATVEDEPPREPPTGEEPP